MSRAKLISPQLITRHTFQFGDLQATWSKKGLRELSWIAHQKEIDRVDFARDSLKGAELQRAIDEFCEGNGSRLSEIDLDFEGLTELTIRVLRLCRKIPLGKVRTYGELAALAGRPAAARFVGQVMARNRFPIVIPCHRVIGANGSLTGYSGSQGLKTKRKLLEFERNCLPCSAAERI